jgi:L-aspartate oxidase
VTDLLVLGSGVAGLSAAIRAARAGLRAAVVTKGELSTSATWYAQGGVAAALDEPDTTELHQADTLVAGAGLCDVDAVHVLVTEGPRRVRELMELGAEFDTRDGELELAMEGGHSLPRVVHAGGDATGAEIERALATAAHELPAIEVHERTFSVDLIVEDGRCVGVRALDAEGGPTELRARHTVLATGGAGQLFSVTTNPRVSTGDGIAMALRAGVAVADVEFMQFHPTALDDPRMPRPLLSEALRGEGAVLRDEAGVRFMVDEHPRADLAPRDVVARAIARRLVARRLEHLWLDTTGIADFPEKFPTIWASAQRAGLDPRVDYLPVAPAAHYLSGGIVADLDGASTLPGLWSCGEAACSGVHGANRLASNSLLDGLVFAPRIVEAILAGKDGPEATGVMRGAGTATAPATAPPLPVGTMARRDLQHAMTVGAGVLRDAASLDDVARVVGVDVEAHDVATHEVRNLLTVARVLVAAACAREESRGTHTRLDFPETSEAFAGRFVSRGGPLELVPLPAGVPA